MISRRLAQARALRPKERRRALVLVLSVVIVVAISTGMAGAFGLRSANCGYGYGYNGYGGYDGYGGYNGYGGYDGYGGLGYDDLHAAACADAAKAENRPPEIAFFPQSLAPGAQTTFYASAYDPATPSNQPIAYTWDFGDGFGGSGQSPKHVYSNAGDYDGILTVEFADHRIATDKEVIHVASASAPTAYISGPLAPKVGVPVHYTASFSGFPQTPTTFSWNFGPGEGSATGQTVTHTWAATGDHRMTVALSPPASPVTRSAWVHVHADRAAVAGFSWRPQDTVAGGIITFGGVGYDPDNPSRTLKSLAWDFGAGTGAGATVERLFATPGSFPVTLTVKFNDNSTASRQHTVSVRALQAGEDFKSQSVPAGGTVTSSGTPSASNPVVTSVTTPVAGVVTIDEKPITEPNPSGFTLFGQQVNIDAPPGSHAEPLRVAFQVDNSALPAGVDASNMEVFRNGVRVPACIEKDGVFQPDLPCVIKRETLASSVRLTVLTVQASAWNFGEPVLPPPDIGGGGGGTTTPTETPPTTTPTTPTTPTTTTTTTPPIATPAVVLKLSATVARARLLAALAKGLRARIKCSLPCVAKAQLVLDAKTAKRLKLKRVVGVTTTSLGVAGSKVVIVKFTANAKRKLRRLRTVKLTLVVTSGKATARVPVTLRR